MNATGFLWNMSSKNPLKDKSILCVFTIMKNIWWFMIQVSLAVRLKSRFWLSWLSNWAIQWSFNLEFAGAVKWRMQRASHMTHLSCRKVQTRSCLPHSKRLFGLQLQCCLTEINDFKLAEWRKLKTARLTCSPNNRKCFNQQGSWRSW